VTGHHVVIVGCGGNIGSHLVPHVARMLDVDRLTLIDRDSYAAKNVKGQDVPLNDVGRPKARVQARRARSINPNLDVTTIVDDVENLPLGAFKGDVLLACLDSRFARMVVNRAAWRLDVPWIDAGVLADDLFARVDLYVPGADNPCYECQLDDRHYAAMDTRFPCDLHRLGKRAPEDRKHGADDHPTNAPSSLGALAASLQAIECQKLLAGHEHGLPPGGQLVLEGLGYQGHVTTRRHNPTCRLPDHAPWEIEQVQEKPRGLTLRDLLARVPRGPDPELALRLDGALFVDELICRDCGAIRRPLRFEPRLRSGDLRCRSCDAQLVVDGFSLVERLDVGTLTARDLRRSLHALGIRPGDVVTVESGGRELHFQIGTVTKRRSRGHADKGA
jgi:molybdopterin/thiamine biosynthesis adenylyltransferase